MVRSWEDPERSGEVRLDRAARLGYALAIFGAEATLCCHAGRGRVELCGRDGAPILAYEGERLAVPGTWGR